MNDYTFMQPPDVDKSYGMHTWLEVEIQLGGKF